MKYYVYVHYTPKEIPFYVGKGKGNRYKVTGYRNADYHEIVKLFGKDNIRIEIIPCSSEKEAIELENKLIQEYRDSKIKLTNIMLHGWTNSGWKHAESTKKRISDAQPMKGKNFKHTEEARKKISEAGKGS